MPCIIIGKIRINSMSGGVVNFGDSLYIAPKNITISGADGEIDDDSFLSPEVDTGVGQAVTDPNIT